MRLPLIEGALNDDKNEHSKLVKEIEEFNVNTVNAQIAKYDAIISKKTRLENEILKDKEIIFIRGKKIQLSDFFPLVKTEFDKDISDEEMNFAEEDALECAARFLFGEDEWNQDSILEESCYVCGHDYDFAWLLTRVLFGPAVWYLETGKVQ